MPIFVAISPAGMPEGPRFTSRRKMRRRCSCASAARARTMPISSMPSNISRIIALSKWAAACCAQQLNPVTSPERLAVGQEEGGPENALGDGLLVLSD